MALTESQQYAFSKWMKEQLENTDNQKMINDAKPGVYRC